MASWHHLQCIHSRSDWVILASLQHHGIAHQGPAFLKVALRQRMISHCLVEKLLWRIFVNFKGMQKGFSSRQHVLVYGSMASKIRLQMTQRESKVGSRAWLVNLIDCVEFNRHGSSTCKPRAVHNEHHLWLHVLLRLCKHHPARRLWFQWSQHHRRILLWQSLQRTYRSRMSREQIHGQRVSQGLNGTQWAMRCRWCRDPSDRSPFSQLDKKSEAYLCEQPAVEGPPCSFWEFAMTSKEECHVVIHDLWWSWTLRTAFNGPSEKRRATDRLGCIRDTLRLPVHKLHWTTQKPLNLNMPIWEATFPPPPQKKSLQLAVLHLPCPSFPWFGCCQRTNAGKALATSHGMGGVNKELTKNWLTFEQLCVQNLALAISCCFSPVKNA